MSCEVRTRDNGEVLCTKSTLFIVSAANSNDASLRTALLVSFSKMMGNLVFFPVFSGTIIVGLIVSLMPTVIVPETENKTGFVMAQQLEELVLLYCRHGALADVLQMPADR